MNKISVIVPVYNESDALKYFIPKLKSALQETGMPSECIIVDDNSNDGTAEILKNSGLVVLTHPVCRGYGAAIKTGVKQATGDIICIIDGDESYSPDDLRLLVENIHAYDMVVGARVKGSINFFPWYQRIAKSVVCSLLNVRFSKKIEDLNSGFRLIKKSIIEKFIVFLPDGFSFTSNITLIVLLAKYKIKYVPISYSKRKGKSKVKILMYTINFLRSYFRVISNFNLIEDSCDV